MRVCERVLVDLRRLFPTDGNGDLVSYDMESKNVWGAYTDASPNAVDACYNGVTPVQAYFGGGLRLDGTSSSLFKACSPTKLDWVNCGMCVDERGAGEAIAGVRRGSPADLLKMAQESDNTLVIGTR